MENYRLKTPLFMWFALVAGAVCIAASVLFAVALFVPGAEYGPYQDYFNLFFPSFLLIGPLLSAATIPIGIVSLVKCRRSGYQWNSCISVVSIVSGSVPLAEVLILFALFIL